MKEQLPNTVLANLAGRIDKMLIPALLFFLAQKPSHGYELIQKVNQAGFVEIEADPATIYRNLRRMEEEGLVASHWDTEHAGPARRAYRLSPAGYRALDHCVQMINDKVNRMQAFLRAYRREVKGE